MNTAIDIRFNISDYLNNIILIMNNIIDFSYHEVNLFNRETQTFNKYWHFLKGVTDQRNRSNETYKYNKKLKDILNNKTIIINNRKTEINKKITTNTSMFIPLFVDKKPIGVLVIESEKDKFSEYDKFLAECVVDVVETGYNKKLYNYLSPTLYCILHRRSYFSETSDIDDVFNEYLSRLIYGESALIPIEKPVSGNIRRIDNYNKSIDQNIIFYTIIYGINRKISNQILKHELFLSEKEIDIWKKRFYKNPLQSSDIDIDYPKIFKNVKKHIVIPFIYENHLHGILSVDFLQRFNLDLVEQKALHVVAAHVSQIIAYAHNRLKVFKERQYLKSILNAIPDEVLIINEDAKIVAMNKAKMKSCPDAKVGQYCYKTLESNKREICSGCYTMHTIRTGQSIRQAIWKYRKKGSPNTKYVEISSGFVDNPFTYKKEAVEIVRDVAIREALLQWMSEMNQHIWQKKFIDENEVGIPSWLIDHISDGLKKMNFPRFRIFSWNINSFIGDICCPGNSFNGKNFKQFILNPKQDLPSRILINDKKMRPIKFTINEKENYPKGKSSIIPHEMHEYNFITCYLKKLPNEYKFLLNMKNVINWVEIPLINYDSKSGKRNIFGKISIDWGDNKEEIYNDTDTAHEMALLYAFSRFISLAIAAVKENSLLIKAEKEIAAEKATNLYATQICHELDTHKLSLRKDLDNLVLDIPNIIEMNIDNYKQNNEKINNSIKRFLNEFNRNDKIYGYQNEEKKTDQRILSKMKKEIKMLNEIEDDQVLKKVIQYNLNNHFMEIFRKLQNENRKELAFYIISAINTYSELNSAHNTQKTIANLHDDLTVGTIIQEATLHLDDIKDTIFQACKFLQSLYEGKAKLKIIYKNSVKKIPMFSGSLKFVWINLIKNAIEASPGEQVVIKVKNNKKYLIVEVIDKGKGLPLSIKNYLLAPYRHDFDHANKHTGISFIKRIVEAHNGYIRLKYLKIKEKNIQVYLPLGGPKNGI